MFFFSIYFPLLSVLTRSVCDHHKDMALRHKSKTDSRLKEDKAYSHGSLCDKNNNDFFFLRQQLNTIAISDLSKGP